MEPEGIEPTSKLSLFGLEFAHPLWPRQWVHVFYERAICPTHNKGKTHDFYRYDQIVYFCDTVFADLCDWDNCYQMP